MNAVKVSPDCVPGVWPRIRPWVMESIANGDGWWSEREAYDRCVNGLCGLWLAEASQISAFAITEIENWDSKRVATIALCGGRGLETWKHILSEIEAWAREWQADEIQVRGRLGWQRVLKEDGYRPQIITLAKALT